MSEPLGQMMIELGLDSSKFGDGLKNAKSQLKYFDSQMKAEVAFYDAFGRKVDSLSAKERGLAHEISDQANVVAKAKKKYDESLSSTGKLSQNSARLAANFEKEQAHLASLTKSYIQTAQAEAEMSVKTTGVTGAINKLGTAQIAIGNRMKSLGDKMTTGITVPIAAAFVAATAKAIKFQNQMTVIKNLLTTGGESAKEAMSGVNQMQSDAVKYSDHYGVSVEKISAGYEELVRRGYTSKQAIAAMKTELQGALASGDDFNDVVSVASSTLESFGMKSNSTATMTRNTKTAVNELAYAADLTATDFQQLGVGMSYVGATAHQAHFTLSETASALGVLSNNGLEADKAGTGLRKVIVSLNTAVKNIGTKKDVLKSLGIKKSDIVQSNGQLKNLSTVMDVLNQHTKSMSATKKAAVFNTLFGTTGQQAGIILAQNSKQLAALNSQVDKAEKKNYVGSLSEKNLKSAQNQIKVLRQNVENLGMTIAQKVLPSVQPLIKDATDAVKWFSQLNPQMQQNIVKWGLLAAAMGPVLSLVGRFNLVSGQIKNGLVGLIAKLAGLSAKSTATKDVMAQLTDTSGNVIGTLTKTGGAAERSGGLFGGLAGKLTVAAGETGALGTAMTPLGLGLAVVAGAATVGMVAWEGWGKQAYQSAQRSHKWGSDIGKDADDAASKMESYEKRVTSALSDTSQSAKKNSKTISSAFKDMYKAADSSTKKQESYLDKLGKAMGGSAQVDAEKDKNKEKKQHDAALAEMKSYSKQADAITAESRKEGVSLTSDQIVQIENLQKKAAEAEVQTLDITQKQRKQVLQAELGDYKTASKSTARSMYYSLAEASKKAWADNINRQDIAVAARDSGKITEAQYKKYMDDINHDTTEATNKMYTSMIGAGRKAGMSWNQIRDDLNAYGVPKKLIDSLINGFKMSGQAAAESGKVAKAAAQSTVVSLDGLNKKQMEAANTWNNLVFDPKTGNLKTNAQEEVNKGVQSATKWNQMKLLIKEGKMTTNGSAMIAQALISQKRWKDLQFLTKNAKLNDKTKEAIASAMISANQWNTKDWKTAQLLSVNKTDSAVIAALQSMGKWDSLTPKQQQMIAQDKTGAALETALRSMGVWNSLPKKVKRLIANDEASQPATNATNAVLKFPTGNKTVTLTTVVKTINEEIYRETGRNNRAISTNNFAKGSSDVPSGLAMVNDQKGPMFREWINDPVLGSFIPHGRNVILPLHKHATVTPAGLTAKMFKGIPQYAGGKDIPANATALTMAKSIVAQNTLNTSGDAASQNKLLDEMSKNNVLLQYLITLITPKMTETDSKPQINTNQVLRALASALGPYSHQITVSASRTGGL